MVFLDRYSCHFIVGQAELTAPCSKALNAGISVKGVGARSSGSVFICSPQVSIARNFLAPAKLPGEKELCLVN